MSMFKVNIETNNHEDSTEIEASSAIEAAMLVGVSLGVGMVAGSNAAAVATQLYGLGYVQHAAEERIRETLTVFTVEEL